VLNVATVRGGVGQQGVRDFYSSEFVGKMPRDTELTPISRTVGEDRVIDEMVLTFTHDREIEFMLPGVGPTGRRVELPHVVVMGFEDGKIAYEHIYWDQASLLVQVGLLDPSLLPASGAEQAHALLDAKARERLMNEVVG
jgi:carboxymethylenebutenolidase